MSGVGTHPYKSQPDRAHWRRSVTGVGPFGLREVYRKKFAIEADDKIATAGSCFAQHIGRRLSQSGFSYLDMEPAPVRMRPDDRARFGYGLFSARYGNVYTVRQMTQLALQALDRFTPKELPWKKDGRFHDPFRPNIEPVGFESPEELEASRASHLRAVRRMLVRMNVFVFTLGLTEAWISKKDGAVFPICPGVVAGQFDEAKYEFHNFTYNEIGDDLRTLIKLLRRRSSDMRVILTVSPVPLAATATTDHVLTATAYSKATLRAIAQDIANGDPLIDYFPSYDIITSLAASSQHYETDLRNVRPVSVDHVMSHFFGEHVPPPKQESADESKMDRDDLICEEELVGR